MLRPAAGDPDLGCVVARDHLPPSSSDRGGRPEEAGPSLGAPPDEALVEALRGLLRDSPFVPRRGLSQGPGAPAPRRPPRQPAPGPAPDGREHGLPAPQRAGSPHGPEAHDGTIATETVDAMGGTGLTPVITGEGRAAVFVAVDHCSVGCAGVHAARPANRFEAPEPVRQGVRERFGAVAGGVASGLRLRHDHGSQYVSDHSRAEIRFLGIGGSPAFVREPEGDGCAERLIRVLKENPLRVRRSDTVAELRVALRAFKETYNNSWIIERHGYRTPAQVRAEQIGPVPVAA